MKCADNKWGHEKKKTSNHDGYEGKISAVRTICQENRRGQQEEKTYGNALKPISKWFLSPALGASDTMSGGCLAAWFSVDGSPALLLRFRPAVTRKNVFFVGEGGRGGAYPYVVTTVTAGATREF